MWTQLVEKRLLKHCSFFFQDFDHPWAAQLQVRVHPRPAASRHRRFSHHHAGNNTTRKILLIFSGLPAFPMLVLQLHFHADWLPMIGAWQPSGLDYWSLPTAAYPKHGRSKHVHYSYDLVLTKSILSGNHVVTIFVICIQATQCRTCPLRWFPRMREPLYKCAVNSNEHCLTSQT